MLLHIYALYKLAGTCANTQLMHWYVLSGKKIVMLQNIQCNFTFHMDASHILLMATMYMI